MKERCHICGRKMKEGLDQCKVCNAPPDEQVVLACQAAHNVNFLVNPFVNLILTDRRLLVFEDMSVVGGQATFQGGLVGSLVGLAADKVVEKTIGANGSLKLDIPLTAVQGVETEDKQKKGTQMILNLAAGKISKFTVSREMADPSAPGGQLIGMLKRTAEG